jgi:catechol 2,3-dioxygenase-like lactoylglutathione lyase family enzyme
MLDHIGINVSDVLRSKGFYEATLAPIGLSLQMEVTPEMSGGSYQGFGFGTNGKPEFWIGGRLPPHSGMHVAFTVGARAEVDAFYSAAIAAGGKDNGAPGVREHYHPNYYAAFVFDPDGNNIEAVCHAPV